MALSVYAHELPIGCTQDCTQDTEHIGASSVFVLSEGVFMSGILVKSNAAHQERRLLRLRSVLEMTGLGRSSLYKMVKEQKFPRPVQIGKRTVAWDSTAVAIWIQERINGKL